MYLSQNRYKYIDYNSPIWMFINIIQSSPGIIYGPIFTSRWLVGGPLDINNQGSIIVCHSPFVRKATPLTRPSERVKALVVYKIGLVVIKINMSSLHHCFRQTAICLTFDLFGDLREALTLGPLALSNFRVFLCSSGEAPQESFRTDISLRVALFSVKSKQKPVSGRWETALNCNIKWDYFPWRMLALPQTAEESFT